MIPWSSAIHFFGLGFFLMKSTWFFFEEIDLVFGENTPHYLCMCSIIFAETTFRGI